jgi:hypothetical protein
MTRPTGYGPFLATAAIAALSACSAPSSASRSDVPLGAGSGGSSGASDASPGAGGQGAGEGTGGSIQAGGGGTVGESGGSAAGGESGASAGGESSGPPSGIDLSGTWIADVKAPGSETIPLVGVTPADIEFVVRLVVRESATTLNATFDVCKLSAVTTPDPTTVVITFTPAVIATLTTTTTENTPIVNVNDAIPLPALTILSGVDPAGTSVDADSDTHPGVTIPGYAWGNTKVNAYVGLTVDASFKPTLSAADTMTGTMTFAANGKLFGSDNALLSSGDISVVTQNKDNPFTAKLLAGEVPCSQVLTMFP